MKKVLISACLLGEPCRYDGRSVPATDPEVRETLEKWRSEGRLVPFCPEVAGGLPVPRPPAEIRGGAGEAVLKRQVQVVTQNSDVTPAFLRGAEEALSLCRSLGIRFALLKEKSPSCGSRYIYDGSFEKRLVEGRGVTAALLGLHEIRVFSENNVSDLSSLL